jgi:hypothetical protein
LIPLLLKLVVPVQHLDPLAMEVGPSPSKEGIHCQMLVPNSPQPTLTALNSFSRALGLGILLAL